MRHVHPVFATLSVFVTLFMGVTCLPLTVTADTPVRTSPADAPPPFHILGQTESLPLAWQGVWDMATTNRDCTSIVIYGTGASRDTLCASANISPGSGAGFSYACTVSVGAEDLTVECSAEDLAFAECTATYGYVYSGTVVGDHLTATMIFLTTYAGAGCGDLAETEFCSKVEFEGTRVGSAEEVCSTPVAGRSWGQIKALHD